MERGSKREVMEVNRNSKDIGHSAQVPRGLVTINEKGCARSHNLTLEGFRTC